MGDNKIVLYNCYSSSASWRVRIALAWKGMEYEYHAVNLKRTDGGAQMEEHTSKRNPMGQVPSMLIDGALLSQSLPMIEYLEERNPDHPLLPKDKLARAKVRSLCEVVNSGIQPLQNVFNKVGAVEKREENVRFYIGKGLKALDEMLKECAGRYSFGDDVTMADLFLVPQTYKALRFNVDTSQFPLVMRVYEELSKLPAFMAAHPGRQPDTPAGMKLD